MHLPIAGLVHVYTIAPAVLGGITGHVRGAQHLRGIVTGLVHRYHADTDADLETVFLVHEAEGPHGIQDILRHAARLVRAAITEQHAELISPQACQDIGFPDTFQQHTRQLAQQFIPGNVPAYVVHHLELVQVEVTECMFHALLLGAVQGQLQALLEFTPVVQAGEGVMCGLVGQLPGQHAGLAYVMKHHDGTEDGVVTSTYGRGRGADFHLDIIGTHQDDLVLQGHGTTLGQAEDDRVIHGLPRHLVIQLQDIQQWAATGLLQAPAGKFFRQWVEVLHTVLGIGGDDGIPDGMEGHLCLLLLLVQGGLGIAYPGQGLA